MTNLINMASQRAYVTFGLTVVSLLWNAASGDMTVEVADATREMNKSVSALAQEVESQGLSAVATHSSLVVVVAVTLVGL